MPFEMPIQNPCLFCERIAGRGELAIVEETPHTLTFVNPRQFEEGQCLVIPKRHVSTVLELSDDDAANVMIAVRRMSRALVATFGADGITLYQNNGRASYQEIPHFHMHVVPRKKGRVPLFPPHISLLEALEFKEGDSRFRPMSQLESIAVRIRSHLVSEK